MAIVTDVAYSAQVGSPLQAGKAYRQRFSAAAFASVSASGQMGVAVAPIQLVGAASGRTTVTGAATVSQSAALAGSVQARGSATGDIGLTTALTQPDGSILSVGLNTVSAVNPCPTGLCVYSGTGLDGIYRDFGGVVAANGGLLAHGAGKWDYWGNEVYRYTPGTRLWSRMTTPNNYDGAYGPVNPSWPWDATYGDFANGAPVPGRMYQMLVWRPGSAAGNASGEMWVLPRSIGYEMEHSVRRALKLNLDTLAWSRASINDGPPTPTGLVVGCAIYSASRDWIYCILAGVRELWRIDCANDAWAKVADLAADVVQPGATVMAWGDAAESHLLLLTASSPGFVLDLINATAGTITRLLQAGEIPLQHAGVTDPTRSAPGFAYCPTDGLWYLYRGRGDAHVYRLRSPSNMTTEPWSWDTQYLTGASPGFDALEPAGIIAGRWAWSDTESAFLWWPGTGQAVQRFRPAFLPAWAPALGEVVHVGTNTFASQDPCPSLLCSYNMQGNTNATGQKALLTNWSTCQYAPDYSPLGALIAWGGGHNAYHGNEVYSFDFSTLTWVRETNPHQYDGAPWGTEGFAAWPWDATWGDFNDNGTPLTTHSYQSCLMRPALASGKAKGEMWVPLRTVTRTYGHQIRRGHKFDLQARAWSRATPDIDGPLGGGGQNVEALYSRKRDMIYVFLPSNPNMNVLRCSDGLWTASNMGGSILGSGNYTLAWLGGEGGEERYIVVVAPVPQQIVDQGYYLTIIDTNSAQKVYPAPTSGPVPQWHAGTLAIAGNSPNPAGYAAVGFDFCPLNGKFYLYRGYGDQFAWTLTPPVNPMTGTWVWATESFAGPTPTSMPQSGIYRRWQWIPKLKSFSWWGDVNAGINLFRPMDAF